MKLDIEKIVRSLDDVRFYRDLTGYIVERTALHIVTQHLETAALNPTFTLTDFGHRGALAMTQVAGIVDYAIQHATTGSRRGMVGIYNLAMSMGAEWLGNWRC